MAQADRSFPFGSVDQSVGHSARPGFSIHPHQFRGRHHAAAIIVVVALAALAFQLFPSQRVTVFSDGGAVSLGVSFNATREGLTGAEVALRPGDKVLEASDGEFSTVAVRRAVPVVVHADGVTVEVRGGNDTVAGVLATASIRISAGDLVLLNGLVTSLNAPIVSHSGDEQPEIRIRRALPVSIVVDGVRQDVTSTALTVGELVAELGLRVSEVDLVTPDVETRLTAGMTVRLAPAKSLNVTIDQTEGSLYTRSETVGDVLAVLGIQLSDKDVISHGLDEPVTNGMNLVITLLRVIEEKVEVSIAPIVIFRTDYSLPPGVVQVVNGSDGTLIETWAVTYENGVEVSREKIGAGISTVASTPTNVIVGPPSDGTVATLKTEGYDGNITGSMTVRATWYDATHGGKERGDPLWGITSTGIVLEKGICAVDTEVIPMGTRFYVPGYGLCLAADVGYAIKGAHIDLGFPENAGSVPWRTGDVEIYFLE